jgi:pyrroloquinoline quinone biosynthesis protein D
MTPRFAPGVRLHHDRARERWVVMAPERMFVPDEIALEVLRLVDGVRDDAAIIDELAERFAARATSSRRTCRPCCRTSPNAGRWHAEPRRSPAGRGDAIAARCAAPTAPTPPSWPAPRRS